MDMVRLSLQCASLSGGDAREVGNPQLSGCGDSIDPGLREKPDGGSCERPYRKPTRVAGCESTEVDG
jgi:hypothetical protein